MSFFGLKLDRDYQVTEEIPQIFLILNWTEIVK